MARRAAAACRPLAPSSQPRAPRYWFAFGQSLQASAIIFPPCACVTCILCTRRRAQLFVSRCFFFFLRKGRQPTHLLVYVAGTWRPVSGDSRPESGTGPIARTVSLVGLAHTPAFLGRCPGEFSPGAPVAFLLALLQIDKGISRRALFVVWRLRLVVASVTIDVEDACCWRVASIDRLGHFRRSQ